VQSHSNNKQIIIRNGVATALIPLVTVLIQFGTVPIMLSAWGPAKYGEWLLLFAIPAYVSWSNLGVGDSSGNAMVMQVAANDRQGAIATFQSCWVLLTAVSAAVLSAAAIVARWCPWRSWLHLTILSNRDAALTVILLCAYAIISQQGSLVESGFRCDGNFALGTACSAFLRLLDAIAGTTCAIFTGSLPTVAFAYLIARTTGTVCYAALLRQKSPWLTFGIRHAQWKQIKLLSAPAFGFVVLSMAQAVGLQGFALLVGASLGSIAVVMFSTLRTLSRVTLQGVMVIAFALWPEFSRAFGAGARDYAKKLHHRAFQAVVGFSLASGLLLIATGHIVYRHWVRSLVPFDERCFYVLVLVGIVNSLWYISSLVSLSTNSHRSLSIKYLCLSTVSLGLAVWTTPHFGLIGAALALLVLDVMMCAVTIPNSLAKVNDKPRTFLADLVEFSSYEALGREVQYALFRRLR
jgi:O-antigen/teichoic acid export membrane protein